MPIAHLTEASTAPGETLADEPPPILDSATPHPTPSVPSVVDASDLVLSVDIAVNHDDEPVSVDMTPKPQARSSTSRRVPASPPSIPLTPLPLVEAPVRRATPTTSPFGPGSVAARLTRDVAASSAARSIIAESSNGIGIGPTEGGTNAPKVVPSPPRRPTAVNFKARRIRERRRGDDRDRQPLYDARAALLYDEAAKAVVQRDFVTAERHLALALSYMPNEPRLIEARDKVKRLRQGTLTSP